MEDNGRGADRSTEGQANRNYVCDVCSLACTRSSSLARHRRIHAAQTVYQCPDCPSSFAQKCDRDEHVRLQHCQCDICGITFPNSNSLNSHLVAHSLGLVE